MKRMMDVLGSLAAVIFFSPLFLAIAIAIKATSKGPILFRQRRVGQYGESFVFLKFRSMYVGNDASIHQEYVKQLIAGKAEKQPSNGNGQGVYKLTRDPRITRVGAFLRKTSLDELPHSLMSKAQNTSIWTRRRIWLRENAFAPMLRCSMNRWRMDGCRFRSRISHRDIRF